MVPNITIEGMPLLIKGILLTTLWRNIFRRKRINQQQNLHCVLVGNMLESLDPPQSIGTSLSFLLFFSHCLWDPKQWVLV
jgi:hypothetical protein